MKTPKSKIILMATLLVFIMGFLSAVIVNGNYVTLYPGEEGRVTVEIENNENFDIEDISISLDLSEVPFTSVGNSVKDVDDLDEDDDDSVSFTLRPSTNIIPGDYNILYKIKYTNVDNSSENFTKEGSFGIRVSSRTDLDFSAETRGNAILGREGQISLEIINRGLGEIKSISVQILPQGFELLSKDKIFVGTIEGDDSDTASFNVIYKSLNPVLSARIFYKDFENNDQEEIVNIPIRVYTEEQALQLGLTSKSNTMTYVIVILVLLILWYIWRKIKKRRKQKQKEMDRR